MFLFVSLFGDDEHGVVVFMESDSVSVCGLNTVLLIAHEAFFQSVRFIRGRSVVLEKCGEHHLGVLG